MIVDDRNSVAYLILPVIVSRQNAHQGAKIHRRKESDINIRGKRKYSLDRPSTFEGTWEIRLTRSCMREGTEQKHLAFKKHQRKKSATLGI